MFSFPTFTEDFRGVDVKPPPDYLQSTHGRDDMSPMWPLLPVHPQNEPFLPQEYSGLNWINVQCQFYI